VGPRVENFASAPDPMLAHAITHKPANTGVRYIMVVFPFHAFT